VAGNEHNYRGGQDKARNMSTVLHSLPANGNEVTATNLEQEKIDALYTHVALLRGSKQIRVLDIEGVAQGTDPELITAHLRVESLDQQPVFNALSYVWGTDVEKEFILCDGVKLPLSKNSFSALRHLRGKFGPITIWIDAICINQKDNEEKESQIPLMGDIYSRAGTAYMWLGEGDESTSKALSYLSRAGFVDYFQPRAGAEAMPRVWAARWALATSLRDSEHDPYLRACKFELP
jgi:hypothetical protein